MAAGSEEIVRLIEPYLDRLRAVPYVKGARVGEGDDPSGGLLTLRTPTRTFTLSFQFKRTYLDAGLTNALISQGRGLLRHPLIVLARYIPRETGERLAAAGINFADEAGNLHLHLGTGYHTLVLGKRETLRSAPETKRPGAATIQVFFVFLAFPDALQWPVRRIAEFSGAGKTAAAEARQRLLAEGLLRQLGDGSFQLADPKALEDRFIQGYGQILRPYLSLGRYRAAETDPEKLLDSVAALATNHDLKWALTGGAGAYELERFYRGDDTPIFISHVKGDLPRLLKLLPDRHGPVTFFRYFGSSILWPGSTHRPVAHPWLLYAELLHQGGARALEAAEELRRRFLEHDGPVA